MAFLARARILPRLVIQRPVVLCQRRAMMTAVPKAPVAGAGRIEDILDVIVKQRKEMEELREEIEELERKNEDLQVRMEEFEEEALSASGIDRDTLEEKLDELEEKLDEAREIVDEIREYLQ